MNGVLERIALSLEKHEPPPHGSLIRAPDTVHAQFARFPF